MSDDQTPANKSSVLSSFPRVFWIANLMELFERGAYYGMNALLAVYLSDVLGFAKNNVGLLQSLVYALTYVLPILGGALADRYGYRRMLLVAFSLLGAGYFLSGQVDSYGAIFATLLLMATGAGLFKPIISGTIARTTNESNSGFGFGIFYWMINLGALIAPILAGYLAGLDWSYVFTASAIYCAAMLFVAGLLYRDPPKPESTKTLGQVIAGAAIVLSDARFMLMIFVYSCFWILYFQNFGTVLWYLRDFIDTTPLDHAVSNAFGAVGLSVSFKLDAEYVTVLNAGTIVLLQMLVSRIVKQRKALPTMVAGMAIGSMGFLCLALSSSVWVFVLGIVVFSIGEMTAHPKYISYVGMVAPQEKKATYMGYAFLYGVVGSLVGSNVGGELYQHFITPVVGSSAAESTTFRFWLGFAVLGVLAGGGLVVYNHFFGTDTAATRKRARTVLLVVYALLTVGSIALFALQFDPSKAFPIKTAVQAGIMLLIGGGGFMLLIRAKTEEADPEAEA
ncbi:MAG: MFS transporter [Myxococcota bacterium]|jgi:dipeptide/tripeptide permease|nr:MFS transporter [Myxococcota bacterium]